jgi:hypothetical protein
MDVERGNTLTDPKTGSSLEKAVAYVELDQCDQEAYIAFRSSLNLGQFTDDCEKVQAATLSIKGRIPRSGTQADIDLLVTTVADEIKTRITDGNIFTPPGENQV